MTPEPGSGRLFLALWPSMHERVRIAEWQTSLRWPGAARLTMPTNLHLTLQFIGPVAPEVFPQLNEGLRVPCSEMSVQLDQVEVWPNGVAALVPSRVPGSLVELHMRLAEAMTALGLPVERRPYRPHVTLARKATGMEITDFQAHEPVRLHAQGYVLAEGHGGQYRVLTKFPST